jgi:hypothetical protein
MLAAWIMQKFGILEPAAVGIAALVLLTITTAAKNAFCGMSREEFLKSLDQ